MPIMIQSTRAELEIRTQNASVAVQGNGTRPLTLESERASVDMQTTLPKIQIDQTASFSDAGLKNIKDFMSDAVTYGQQIFSEGIARIVSDGNTMATIENGYDPIPDQAYQNAYAMFEHEFNYGAVPTSRPTIEVIEGSANYRYNPGRVQNQTKVQPVTFNYTPGQVEVKVKSYGKVEISYDSQSLNYHI